MICDSSLWKIICSNPFWSIACTNFIFSIFRSFCFCRFLSFRPSSVILYWSFVFPITKIPASSRRHPISMPDPMCCWIESRWRRCGSTECIWRSLAVSLCGQNVFGMRWHRESSFCTMASFLSSFCSWFLVGFKGSLVRNCD